MSHVNRLSLLVGVALVSLAAMSAERICAQDVDPNAAPNPYREDVGWAKTALGRPFGSTIGVDIDRDGKSVWVYDRCGGGTCQSSKIAPVMKFDPTGRLLAAFGSGLVNDPHGFYVDRDNNIWLSDFRGKDGKGHTVHKLSPDGKVLMTLGRPGVAGDGPDTFNSPTDVQIAPNGDIFVADGHGAQTNARIVKLSKEGKFIKTWGKEGKAPGEFDVPHGLAMDSQGRLFVADRANNRIQIFDQDGKFLAEWKQFGRPSGVFIDKSDNIYVADSQSSEKTNPGFRQGIRIGSAKDGKVMAFIVETADLGALEGVAADDLGNVYAGYTNKMNFRRFVKK
jgi:DNA-binding beta-propeller fold protein YncE